MFLYEKYQGIEKLHGNQKISREDFFWKNNRKTQKITKHQDLELKRKETMETKKKRKRIGNARKSGRKPLCTKIPKRKIPLIVV